MKRIGTMGVVFAFVSTATTALAAQTPNPGIQQQSSLSQDFPNLDASAAQQAPKAYPAAASQDYRHRNHPACAVYTPDWPYSVEGP